MMSTQPYIVCHMLTSINGKIAGPFITTEVAELAGQAYERVNQSYQPDAWLCGRVTMEEFTDGKSPDLDDHHTVYPREDYIAKANEAMYVISVDPSGKLGWTQNEVEYEGRPKAHVVQLLTQQVSDAYLAYLRHYDVTYLFVGDKEIDFHLAVKKLQQNFGIETLMVSGGGYVNDSFLREGLIDEISLVMTPVYDGERQTHSIFERSDSFIQQAPVSFSLHQVEPLDSHNLWIRYKK